MTLYLGSSQISSNTPSALRNIGEIVQSAVPLTDGALHLLDGSLISGSGVYADFVDYIGNLYDNYPDAEYNSNVTIHGSLTDNNGVLSGFSDSTNYATLPQQFSPSNKTWEIVLKTKINGLSQNSTFISGQGNQWLAFFVTTAGLLGFNLGNGSAWITGDTIGTTSLQTNTDYYIKLQFTGTQYISYISTDGTTWTQEAVYTGSSINISATLNIGVNRFLLDAFDGYIDLTKSYINIDGVRWWTGATPKGIFVDEAAWQNNVTTYGVCGKFVYDRVNDTVRIPKIDNVTKNISSQSTLGDIVQYQLASSGTSKLTTTAELIYIVLATSSKTDVQVDIDNIVTDLNGKADVDLTNVNNSGTSRGAGWAMPSTTYETLTLGSSGAQYTAPANGWAVFTGNSTGSSSEFYLKNITTGIRAFERVPASGKYPDLYVPCQKGDIIQVEWYNANAHVLRFIYAEGSKSEA